MLLVLLPLFLLAVLPASSCGGAGEEAARLIQPQLTQPELIQPQDLVYRGAFRLPGAPGEESGWEYSGTAMAYYPAGDPQGPDDGFPGSIFGTGHDVTQEISELSIPAPVISPQKDPDELNTAAALQDFHDIRGGFVDNTQLELPRAGMAWLPPQGSQQTGKLYFCWGQHYQDERVASHGWCETDLSDPQAAGGWFVADRSNYSTNDYMLEIPEQWAAAHTPGKLLGTGRFRDGGWSGQGPSLYAIGPWNQGDPPGPQTVLEDVQLLQYTPSDAVAAGTSGAAHTMQGYHHSDEWSGAAWLTAGEKSALVFVGTKGTGECWYGFSNGVVWPDEPPYPPVPEPPHDDRGWWSSGFTGQIAFYDPADLAAVAAGEMEPYEPQPYASLDIDEFLFGVRGGQQKYHVGAAAYDSRSRLLYVFEPLADGDRNLVHVWEVEA